MEVAMGTSLLSSFLTCYSVLTIQQCNLLSQRSRLSQGWVHLYLRFLASFWIMANHMHVIYSAWADISGNQHGLALCLLEPETIRWTSRNSTNTFLPCMTHSNPFFGFEALKKINSFEDTEIYLVFPTNQLICPAWTTEFNVLFQGIVCPKRNATGQVSLFPAGDFFSFT